MDFSGIVKWVAGSIDLFKLLDWANKHPAMYVLTTGVILLGLTLWAHRNTTLTPGFSLYSIPGVAASLISLMLVGAGLWHLTF